MSTSSPGSWRAFSRALSHTFPTPQLLSPRAVGVDISDASIKWLNLVPEGDHYRVTMYGDEPLAAGVVAEGVIKDTESLVEALRTIKKKMGRVDCAHAALPEEAAYVFNMHVPRGTGYEQTLRMIEFELEARVPIPPDAAVFDFDVITERDEAGMEIGVFVFPSELAKGYVQAFEAAGIRLLSLEIEARSIARAVTKKNDPITMIVDFGRARTSIAVVKNGIPIFTTTVVVGGDTITRAVQESLGSADQAQVFKNERGLFAEQELKKESAQVVVGAASALADEVARHFRYWDTRRNEQDERTTPVERVILVGGSANLKGLDDFIAGKVQAETTRGNIWQHIADFEHAIPPIDRRTSMQYATAAGLALRSVL